MNKMFKGTIMVLVAGIFWGISGVSGQYLMAHGMNVDLLSCVRLITAGVIMTTIAALNQCETFLKAVTSLKVLGCPIFFDWACAKSVRLSKSNRKYQCWNSNGYTVYGTDSCFGVCFD